MKALSVIQPWAWAFFHASPLKDIENRVWHSSYRGPLLIHASKKYDREGQLWIEDEFGIIVPGPNSLPRGAIVGQVNMIDCVQNHGSLWFFGPYGFVFDNPQALEPWPCRGELGIFEVTYP